MILPGKNKPVDSDSLSRSLISLNKQYEENKKKLEALEKKLKNIKIVDFVLSGNMGAVTSNAVKNELDTNYYNKQSVDSTLTNYAKNIIGAQTTGTVDYTKSSVVKIHEVDARSSIFTPNDYIGRGVGMYSEFHSHKSLFGSIFDNIFYTVITLVPWRDTSGGLPYQIIIGDEGMYTRKSVDVLTWGELKAIVSY